MAIEFVCPACRGALRVADDAAGSVVRCGSCMTTLRVPVPPDGGGPPPPRSAVTPVSPPEPTRDRGDTDEFGEPRPRRRRRRQPPPKAGRGPLFWVIVIVLLLGFLTVAACGGLFLVLAQPHWHTHESGPGHFKIDLPADARADIAEMAKAQPQEKTRIEGALLIGRAEVYTVTYTEIDPWRRIAFDDAALLKKAVDGIREDKTNEVQTDEPATVGKAGYAARKVVIHNPEGETYVCRVVVAGKYVYVLAVGGPLMTEAGNERAERFFQSFEVTDPQAVPRKAGEKKGARPPRAKEPEREDGDE